MGGARNQNIVYQQSQESSSVDDYDRDCYLPIVSTRYPLAAGWIMSEHPPFGSKWVSNYGSLAHLASALTAMLLALKEMLTGFFLLFGYYLKAKIV